MSTGKRLAKRSILGTRVACSLDDGKYYAGTIVAVKTPEEGGSPSYSVKVEGERRSREVRESDLVGSGFTAVSSVKLRSGQKVYITHNNREVHGTVLYHRPNIDEVLISVVSPEIGIKQDVKKRIEDIRLLESRKSARLADQDTDFAKLADMSTDRKDRKPSQTIDVPASSTPLTSSTSIFATQGSRKRRSSRSEEDQMDECAAAMVLMKLSCSPRSNIMHDDLHSPTKWPRRQEQLLSLPSSAYLDPSTFCPLLSFAGLLSETMSGGSSVSSGVWSWVDGGSSSSSSSSSSRSPDHRSATPSPPLSESSPPALDDGLDLDDSLFDDSVPRKRRSSTRTMFKCTWTGCQEMTSECDAIERHIRSAHLGREEVSSEHSDGESDDEDDHEEEFYWREVEVNVATWVDPCEPLVSHNGPPPPTPPTPALSLSLTVNTSLPSPMPSQPPVGPAFPVVATQPSQPQQQYIQVSSPPTLSHMDMVRPPHEDPDYKRNMVGASSNLSSSWPRTSTYLNSGRCKIRVSASPKASPGRGKRNGESRKCRKVYGMEQRDLWCTQCKWKKACSRFGE